MTEDGIEQNLIRVRDGFGWTIGDAYADGFLARGWMTNRREITDEGRAELERRRAAA